MKTLEEFFNDQNDITLTYESDLEAMFDEMLDLEGPLKIAGLSYYPSDILKNVDPTAYRCGLLDYIDADYIEFEGGYLTVGEFEDLEARYEDYLQALEEEEDEEV